MTDLEEELRDALQWALPLAELAMEDCRQTRLLMGHDDIGTGTDNIGLWPFEVRSIEVARAVLAKALRGGQ